MIYTRTLIEEYAGRWSSSMNLRQSVRKYSGKEIENEKLNTLKELGQKLSSVCIDTSKCNIEGENKFTNGVNIVIEKSRDDIFKGFIGGYGKISGATAVAIFIGDGSDPNIEEKIGYLGEAIILEATALGIASCWVAGTYSKGKLAELLDAKGINPSGTEKIYAIAALGYTLPGFGETSNLTRGLVSSKKRKELDEISPDYDRILGKSSLPTWFISGIEAVRIAPSAINRQPWIFRYFLENSDLPGRVSLSMDMKGMLSKVAMPKVDCGISMLHFEIGAYGLKVTGSWTFSRHPEIASFRLTNF